MSPSGEGYGAARGRLLGSLRRRYVDVTRSRYEGPLRGTVTRGRYEGPLRGRLVGSRAAAVTSATSFIMSIVLAACVLSM